MAATISVAIATHNEAANIAACLQAVQTLADEIIIVDGESTDDTVAIAKSFGAKVFVVPNVAMFHKNKQQSFERSSKDWILYLDADEIITPALAKEIREVVDGKHQQLDISAHPHFAKHMAVIAARDGVTYTQDPPINGYFIARKNYFLGSYLMHAGVYPDGVIRLFRRNTGYLPCKSVHEQVVIDGGVSWLAEPMIHMSDPTFERYLARADRYTTQTAKSLLAQGVRPHLSTFLRYCCFQPLQTFFLLYIRHKGVLDGFAGFVWCVMSALHWPMAYMKVWEHQHEYLH